MCGMCGCECSVCGACIAVCVCGCSVCECSVCGASVVCLHACRCGISVIYYVDGLNDLEDGQFRILILDYLQRLQTIAYRCSIRATSYSSYLT